MKLGERPARVSDDRRTDSAPPPARRGPRGDADVPLGLFLQELDRQATGRQVLPKGMKGLVIARVEPMSASFDSGLERGTILLEINRQPVTSPGEVRQIVRESRSGDTLTMYIYVPDLDQRQIKTVRVEER